MIRFFLSLAMSTYSGKKIEEEEEKNSTKETI